MTHPIRYQPNGVGSTGVGVTEGATYTDHVPYADAASATATATDGATSRVSTRIATGTAPSNRPPTATYPEKGARPTENPNQSASAKTTVR